MPLSPGTRLGEYQIEGLLGAGGMGEVYRAVDPHLHRAVAIKVIADAFAHDATFRDRFRREARLLAALSHPNIATIYSVEEAGSRIALAMELVEGQSLSELIRPGGLPLERLLRIAVQIVDALAAAHERGISHRDLKPANIMVAGDGRVKILDFGLAKLTRDHPSSETITSAPLSDPTAVGHIVGTPSYMSPEQAEGTKIDHRSDIFSFGIVLYEMATGERPFKGGSMLSILSSIVRDTPTPPLQLNPALPRELARIIKRCLAKEPEERFQSARDLANDLTDLKSDYSSGDSARTLAAPRRSGLRHPLLMATSAALLLAGGFLGGRVSSDRDATAIVASQFVQLTSGPELEIAPDLSPDGRWVVFARRSGERSDVYLQAVGGENAINLTQDIAGSSDQPAFSPDGERIAFRVSGPRGGLFVMGRTGELLRRISDAGYHPSWSPDGKALTFSTSFVGDFPSAHGGGAEIWIVDSESGEKRRLTPRDALQPAWSPDGRWIAYWGLNPATHQRDIFTVSPQGGEPVTVTDDAANDGSPEWSPDSRYVYFSTDRGGTQNIWRVPIDASTGGPLGEHQPVTVPTVNAVHPTLSGDGRRLAYASYSWSADVYSARFDPSGLKLAGAATWMVGGPNLWSAARVSPDGGDVALVRWGNQHDLFLIRKDGTGLRRLTSDAQGVRCPEWSPDGRRIAYQHVLKADGLTSVIEVDSAKTTTVRTAPDGTAPGCPAWAPDGRRLALSVGSGAAIVDLESTAGHAPQRLPDIDSGFVPRSWSGDGRFLAGTIGTRLALYALDSGKYEMLTGDAGTTAATLAPWLPGGRQILFLGPDRTDLRVVDIRTRVVTQVLSVSPGVIRGASLTADGGHLVYSAGREEGEIWVAGLAQQP